MGLIDALREAAAAAATEVVLALPSLIAAALIIAIGYYVGGLVGRAVNRFIERIGLERIFDKTELGKAYRKAGIDLSDFVGALVKAFVIVLSILIAVEYLKIGGVAGQYIGMTAVYLVRIVGAVIVLTLGAALFELLATFIAQQFSVVLPERQRDQLTDLIKDVLLVGLLAFLLSIVFNILMLPGGIVYPLILGVAAIALGISISERIVDSIAEAHEEFREVSGYAKFLIVLVFLIVGVAGIFGTVPGTTLVIEKLAWGIAIAAALLLVPVMYSLARKLAVERAG